MPSSGNKSLTVCADGDRSIRLVNSMTWGRRVGRIRRKNGRHMNLFLLMTSTPFLCLPFFCICFQLDIKNHKNRYSNNHKLRSICKTSLFGINGFRTWIQTQFPTAIATIEQSSQSFSAQRSQQSSSTTTNAAYFDHVLVDVQHMLHVVIRKSQSHSHALYLLQLELEKCFQLATPISSLVLALDGKACAAKQITQKQRRHAIIKRSLWLETKFPLLLQAMSRNNNTQYGESIRFKAWKKRLRKDERALCITPNHEFMYRASKTCQQWASSKVRGTKIQYHVSTSHESGEGELKLLYWLLQNQSSSTRISLQDHDPRDTSGAVAFIGGDSDLILLSLAIPPTFPPYHISIILPADSYRKSYLLNVSHFMNSLSSMLSPIRLSITEMYHMKIDLILLFIMNGNDYLPKVRGSPGLQLMFQTYITLFKQEWSTFHRDNSECSNNTRTTMAVSRKQPFFFFLDARTQQNWNTHFCQLYFHTLDQSSPRNIDTGIDNNTTIYSKTSYTPLSCLQDLVNIGIIPGPIIFDVEIIHVEGGKMFCEKEKQHEQLFKLSLADYQFKIPLDIDTSKKKAKQALAQMALDSLFGVNHTMYTNTLFSIDDDEVTEMDHDTSSLLNTVEQQQRPSYETSMKVVSSSWNTKSFVADTSEYLKGLQWNIKMYQEGICSDYEYNYGNRAAPTVYDLLYHFNDMVDGMTTIAVVD